MSPSSGSPSSCSRPRRRARARRPRGSSSRSSRRAAAAPRADRPHGEMALSDDQRALLRLLMAGDTYEHVADVLGTSPSEVRGRAAEAAEVLESDPEPELSPAAVRDRLAELEGGPPPSAAVSPTAAAGGRFAGWRSWIPWIAVGVAVVIAL